MRIAYGIVIVALLFESYISAYCAYGRAQPDRYAAASFSHTNTGLPDSRNEKSPLVNLFEMQEVEERAESGFFFSHRVLSTEQTSAFVTLHTIPVESTNPSWQVLLCIRVVGLLI